MASSFMFSLAGGGFSVVSCGFVGAAMLSCAKNKTIAVKNRKMLNFILKRLFCEYSTKTAEKVKLYEGFVRVPSFIYIVVSELNLLYEFPSKKYCFNFGSGFVIYCLLLISLLKLNCRSVGNYFFIVGKRMN